MKRKNIYKYIIVMSMFIFGSIFFSLLFKSLGINTKLFDGKDLNYYNCFVELVYAIIIYLLYRNYFRADFKEIKSGFKKYIGDILKYFALFMFIKILSALVTTIVGYLIGTPIGESENQIAIISLTESAPLIMLITASFLAPIVEEGIFRLSLRKIVNNKYLYILLSGLIFGFIHIFPTDLSLSVALTYSITYVAMGVFIAYVYVDTDNIWIPIIIHALNNLIGMLAIIFIG